MASDGSPANRIPDWIEAVHCPAQLRPSSGRRIRAQNTFTRILYTLSVIVSLGNSRAQKKTKKNRTNHCEAVSDPHCVPVPWTGGNFQALAVHSDHRLVRLADGATRNVTADRLVPNRLFVVLRLVRVQPVGEIVASSESAVFVVLKWSLAEDVRHRTEHWQTGARLA